MCEEMQNVKKILINCIYSFCLVILWGICFISYPEANQVTCGIGLVLTFISSYFIQRESDFKLKLVEKLILLIFPTFYYLFFIFNDINYLISPLLIGLILLIFNLFIFKDLKNFRNNIFFVLITISYTTFLFNRWQYVNSGESDSRSIIIDGSENKTQEKKQEIPHTTIDISSFSFLDLKLDTVKIETDKPYIFIGTWNEDCAPCKKAIKELTPMLDSLENVETYFLYINHKFDKNVFISSTQKVEKLSDQNVLADYSLEFYESTKMIAYPTFLIIDNENSKIDYMVVGYGNGIKKQMVGKLREANEK